MGGRLTKGLNCCGCFKSRNKVAPEGADERESHETDEERIINNLQSLGLIKTKPGGSTFNVVDNVDRPIRPPRILPAIAGPSRQARNKSIYTREEHMMMAEIRRDEVLLERGRMGRTYNDRRRAVLARRDQKILKRIRKTEEKLKKDEERMKELIMECAGECGETSRSTEISNGGSKETELISEKPDDPEEDI